jgi:ubiquinone/menaquinone biosynthesis C-methylase UbiE
VTSPESAEYARVWNETYALNNDPVRRHLIYPTLHRWVSTFAGMDVLDVGGGNGALLHELRTSNYRSATLVDINADFLNSARRHISDPRVKFVEADLTAGIPLPAASIDIAVSIFVLNELATLGEVFCDLSRVLRPHGRGIFFVTHPFFVLYWHLKAQWTGEENKKIIGNDGYFDRKLARYAFTLASTSAPYYQHTFADYINECAKAHFSVTVMEELCTDLEEFRSIPSYWDTRDIPKFLVFEIKHLDPLR